MLGRTTDYTAPAAGQAAPTAPAPPTERGPGRGQAARPRSTQRRGGSSSCCARSDLAVDHRRGEDPEPFDIARVPARPPAPRSAVLAAMARAETGALVALWYRSILGPDGDIHEVTLGEVRHGRLPLRVRHPHTGEPVTVGAVPGHRGRGDRGPRRRRRGPQPLRRRLRAVLRAQRAQGDRDGRARHREPPVRPRPGRWSSCCCSRRDGLDSGGFLEHLKLPHYVTFRSMVERKQALQTRDGRR